MSLLIPKGGRRKRPPEPGAKDERHLRLIRQCQCLACGREPVEAAHVRYADFLRGKPITGIGRKPEDFWTVPLCPDDHRNGPNSQHGHGDEREWWELHRIDPLDVATRLYEASSRGREAALPEHEIISHMRAIVRRARRRQQ